MQASATTEAAGSALQLFPNHGWRNGWFDPAPLRAQARRIFGDFTPRIPFGVVVVEALPVTAGGKVLKRELRARHRAGDDHVVSYERSG